MCDLQCRRSTDAYRRPLAGLRRYAGWPEPGTGWQPLEALGAALQPFDGVVDELLESLPDILYWR